MPAFFADGTPATILMRSGGFLVPTSAIAIEQPALPPDEADWEQLFADRDLVGLDGWYEGYTGARYTPTRAHDDGVVDDAWLASNEGNGNVSLVGGQWLVERMSAGNFRVAASNVTFRDCVISSGGNFHGFSNYIGENPSGIVIEHCTIDGQAADWLGITFGSATEPGQITSRRNNITGYRCGMQIIGGFIAEENWVHDLHYAEPDPHVTGVSIRSRNVLVRRNRIADGNSSALAFYDENTPYTGIVAEENIISTGSSQYEVSYPGTPSVGADVSLIGNLFERGSIANGHNFTVKTGNVNLAGDPV